MRKYAWSRLLLTSMVIVAGYVLATGQAPGQTTRTSPSATSTVPTIPFSSSTSANSPCASSNPTSPCFSTRAPRNPCYSAVSPNEPCSTTTTPYSQISPSPRRTAKAPSTTFQVFTQDQAKALLEAKEYSKVSGLRRDTEGVWHGKAEKDGLLRNVTIDTDGNVSGD